MALAGELAKYIGGELVKNTGKELSTKAATSALSDLAPKIATKAVADIANKSVLNSLVPTATRKLASGIELGTDMIPMFRGQMNTLEKLDYNKGLSPIVADENGVAKTFYHGSPSMDITDFDINMAGKNTRSGERAIWFTDDYPTAEEFSYERIPGDTLFADKRGAKGKVYERNLGLENPLDLSNLSDKQIEELYKYADSRMAFDGKENFIRRMKEFRDAGNDQLIKSQLDMKKLSNSEYDGIVAKMYPGESEVREIGVFDTKKIKRLDNKK